MTEVGGRKKSGELVYVDREQDVGLKARCHGAFGINETMGWTGNCGGYCGMPDG